MGRVIKSSRFNQMFGYASNPGSYSADGTWIPGVQGSTTYWGIIHPSTPKELEILEEGERTGEFITIFSLEKLETTTPVQESGYIVWQDLNYKVKSLNRWLDFGYYETIAVRILKNA